MWLHAGHSGVAWIKIPGMDLAVVVFTNLERPKSNPEGLAIAVAGLLEPQLSLHDLPRARGAVPAAARGLHRDYELYYAGKPDLQRYTPHARRTMWQQRETFAGISPQLGALKDWQFLRSTVTDNQDSYLFRATHEHGEIYSRFSVTRDGHIDRLVWWHL